MNNDNITLDQHEKQSLFDPQRWGLPENAVDDLANRLKRIWMRFKNCFTTKTRDTSEYALVYMRGLLTMDTNRNYANTILILLVCIVAQASSLDSLPA